MIGARTTTRRQGAAGPVVLKGGADQDAATVAAECVEPVRLRSDRWPRCALLDVVAALPKII